mgnify:FL=1
MVKQTSKFQYSDEACREFVLEAHKNKWASGNRTILKRTDFQQTDTRSRSFVNAIVRRYGWLAFLRTLGLHPTDERLIELYEVEGWSTQRIANHYGYSKGAIRQWLNALGVKMRTMQDYDLIDWNREPTRFISKSYVYLRFPGAKSHVLEHRFVMEQQLGRKLRKNEIVHHLNAIKTDNRTENLAVIKRRKHKTGDNHNYRKAYQNRIRELEAENRRLSTMRKQQSG